MLEHFNYINTFIFDVDGVLTDGSLLVMPNGLMARRMNIKDGYALQLAVKKGYQVIVISGGNAPEVKDRLNKLGVSQVHMHVTEKLGLLKSILKETNSAPNSCIFMGDDIPDLECMKWVGLPVCPADAVSEIKDIALYISSIPGGMGCARDVIEKVMKLRGDWNEDFSVRAQ